jgi:hypothetical protein
VAQLDVAPQRAMKEKGDNSKRKKMVLRPTEGILPVDELMVE